ncbi:hypothetical protein [Hyphobacterium sp.]|uniref:hypothetical protein n=1 Tax=Hyphobacterium sp. TaxID=2004662 RepID=UPI003B523017
MMKRVYILSQLFDPDDRYVSSLREKLQAAGLAPIVLADRAMPGDHGGDVIVLRARALAALTIGSQLIIAAIILGYFSRFYPSAMTLFFWALVGLSAFIASRYGEGLRNAVLRQIVSILAKLTFAQKRPAAIWQIDAAATALTDAVADRQEAIRIIDLMSPAEKGDTTEGWSGDERHRLREADIVLSDSSEESGPEDGGDLPSERVFSDPDAAISALAAKLA